jgi:hypothetical protein
MSKSIKNKNILLWCSPGFGMVDMWLPIIRKIKKSHNITIDFVFPEPSSLTLEDDNSDLFKLSYKLADRVFFKGNSGRWFVSHNLVDARNGVRLNKYNRQVMQLSRRLLKGRASTYFLLRIIGRFILFISKYIISIKEHINNNLYDISLLSNVDGIFCDITVEDKTCNKLLKSELKHIAKFSMAQGTAATWYMKEFLCREKVDLRKDLFVYSMSHLESTGYQKCFGALESNMVYAGIPKHDNDWIEFIRRQSVSVEKDLFDSYVFIISRPASPYITPERKKRALMDIYNIICVKYKLKLVIKKHPKESLDGIDGDIYMDALGKDNYGTKWMFSNKHPFVLGGGAVFCVSFYSGVILDMLAINKSTIEYLDLRGLDKYDNDDSLRDEYGAPVFSERYEKLVLGASTEHEFEKHVENILDNYKEVLLPLKAKYEECFVVSDNSSDIIVKDIMRVIE